MYLDSVYKDLLNYMDKRTLRSKIWRAHKFLGFCKLYMRWQLDLYIIHISGWLGQFFRGSCFKAEREIEE